MFAVIYTFHVKKGEEKDFVKSWSALTKLIIKHEGSKGSRLHLTAPGIYMAYAQWPDKKTWESMGKSLPATAKKHSEKMHECCSSIRTSHTMEMVDDQLIHDS